MSLIEACAAGRAVIGTRVGGIPDIIAAGVNGLLVPSGDAAALAGAIVQLVDDPERRGLMGVAGQRSVRERYGADRMAVARRHARTMVALGQGCAIKL